MSLTGKSIIVTGGAAGLGLAIAKALSGAGASITICDISYESVKSVQAANASFVVVEADVFYIADVEKVFHAAKCRFGNVDGLVNNAGVMLNSAEPIETASIDPSRAWFNNSNR
jgi:NAD(P)-dependent dehydrogenase (short-subunit alcohol dehydrogenase family)